MAADVTGPETPDVPKGPETQSDPVLIEAEEALRRASEGETTALDLRDKGLRMTLLDGALKQVNKKIAAIEAKDKKEPKDFDKLSELVTKKTELEATQAKIMAIPDAKADEKIAKVEGTLKSHATDLEGRLKEIDQVQARMAVVQGEMDTYKTADDPEGRGKYAAALKEMSELTKALAALEKEGSEEKQRAQHEATLAAEKKAATMREQAHAEEVETAEKGLSEFEGNPDEEKKDPEKAENKEATPTDNKEADKGKDKSTSSEGEEEKAARKKELLQNALHKVAYGLAVDLEKNYPGTDGNAYEKMEWNGKAFLLKIVVMFGGTPKWAELVKDNPTLSEFLEKKVGMTFVQEDVKKDGVVVPGEKRWAVKWEKPVEGWEPGIVEMADVFETAYGKENGPKMMEKITADITLQELKDTAPETNISEEGVKTRRLVKAMEDAGAEGETKVQEFLTKNAGEVKGKLEPTGGESTSAPSETIEVTRRTAILAACRTHAETMLTGSSDEDKISTLQFDSATILPLTTLDFPEIKADAGATPILDRVKLVVKVPTADPGKSLTFGLDASDKVVASENHL